MKAQELRIGNYVLDSGGKVLRIDFFEHLQSGYDCKFGQRMFLASEEVHPMTDYTNSANPIPLTEQWLINFGFEIGVDYWFKDEVILDISPEGLSYRFHYNIIPYVHQLQNLYFALTSNELKKK